MLGHGLNITKRNTPIINSGIDSPADISGLSLWMDANDTTTVNAKLAAQFASASSEYLSSSNAVFKVGDEDFSFGGWFYSNSTGDYGLIGKFGSSGNFSYTLLSYSNQIWFMVSGNGITYPSVIASAPINTWHFAVGVHDSVNNLIKISVDGNTFITSAFTGGVYSSSTTDFRIGRYQNNYFTGRADSCFFYKKALSQAQVTALYNGGNGVAYENLTADQLTSLTAWWSLNERSGNRADEHGGYTLTDNNTVTYGLGKVQEPIEPDEYVWSWVDKSSNAFVFSQDTAASQPQWKDSGFGTNSMPYISFDGTDDYLNYIVANVFSGDNSGTLFVVATTPNITSSSRLSFLSSADTASNVRYISLAESSIERGTIIQSNNAYNEIRSVTNQTANNNPMLFMFQSTGTEYKFRTNKIAQATLITFGDNDGDWFADTDNRDNLVIGAMIRNTISNYGLYNICEMAYYSSVLNGTNIRKMEKYFSDKYGTF